MEDVMKLWFKTVGLVSLLTVMVSGVTFAAMQSQNAVLAGSSITSATASLLIASEQGDFGASTPGFNFEAIEPGASAMPTEGKILRLRNAGNSKLALRVGIDNARFANPQGAIASKIFIVLTPGTGGPAQEFPLPTLMSALGMSSPLAIGQPLTAGQETEYKVQVRMAGDALPAGVSGANITGIDLVFSGVTLNS